MIWLMWINSTLCKLIAFLLITRALCTDKKSLNEWLWAVTFQNKSKIIQLLNVTQVVLKKP